MKDLLTTLLDYHYWANARVLDTAAQLPPTALAQPVQESHKSLRNIFFHMLRAEHVWRNLCEHGQVTPIQNHEFVLLPDLRTRWREEEQALRAYVAGLSEADLNASVELRDAHDNTFTETRWHMLIHLLTHSTQHRSEATLLLTRFNQSPGDLDFIFYLDEANGETA